MEAKRGAETHPAFYSDEPTLGYYSHGAEEKNNTFYVADGYSEKCLHGRIFLHF